MTTTFERLSGEVDTFGKYTIKIDLSTAETILELIRTLDYSTLTKQQVYELNGLQLNLEAIKEEADTEAFNNFLGMDVQASLDKLTIRRTE